MILDNDRQAPRKLKPCIKSQKCLSLSTQSVCEGNCSSNNCNLNVNVDASGARWKSNDNHYTNQIKETFKNEINSVNSIIKSKEKNTLKLKSKRETKQMPINDFMQRNIKWKEERDKRFTNTKILMEQKTMNECTFKPKISSNKAIFKCSNRNKENNINSISHNKQKYVNKLNQLEPNNPRFDLENIDANNEIKISHKNYSITKEKLKHRIETINKISNKILDSNWDPKIINKPDEAVLDLSDSPSFNHRITSKKKAQEDINNFLASSAASKR